VVLVSTSIATVAESCSPSAARQRPTTAQLAPPEIPVTGYLEKNYPDVPMTPDHLPSVRVLQFFTEAEARLMDAIAGRIIPGTPDDPGAREADVFLYIDHKLAYPKNHGFVEPTYFRAPFAKLYEGDVPPPSSPESPKEIWVSAAQIDRYGFQGGMTPQDTYRRGLLSVDKYAQEKFQKKFVDLSEAQQDQILEDMDNGDAKGFDKPTDRVFFKTLRDDVIEGMFSDPVYGGNKDMVGWSLIGYPGAQRAYTPDDLHTEGNVRPPQSIAQLQMFHAGQPANPDVIVPPSGSEYEQQNNQK
jgi:gluconate 2-dehydrogenase gamma chain